MRTVSRQSSVVCPAFPLNLTSTQNSASAWYSQEEGVRVRAPYPRSPYGLLIAVWTELARDAIALTSGSLRERNRFGKTPIRKIRTIAGARTNRSLQLRSASFRL